MIGYSNGTWRTDRRTNNLRPLRQHSSVSAVRTASRGKNVRIQNVCLHSQVVYKLETNLICCGQIKYTDAVLGEGVTTGLQLPTDNANSRSKLKHGNPYAHDLQVITDHVLVSDEEKTKTPNIWRLAKLACEYKRAGLVICCKQTLEISVSKVANRLV